VRLGERSVGVGLRQMDIQAASGCTDVQRWRDSRVRSGRGGFRWDRARVRPGQGAPPTEDALDERSLAEYLFGHVAQQLDVLGTARRPSSEALLTSRSSRH
jgi:hypothetical protein